MNEPVTFTVPAFSIPYSNRWLTDTLRLNQFQVEVYRLVEKGRDVLVTAPTGGGKTLTLLLNPINDIGASGFAAVYPNNTLLLNQLCTVEDIVLEHFGARLVEALGSCEVGICTYPNNAVRRCECAEKNPERACIEPLTIYEVDKSRVSESWSDASYIALLALSGKYIVSRGEPKREVLYNIARKILKYRRKGGIYTIIFATPDTYLLLMTGAYRDFDGVGKTVHNMLLAIAEGRDLETVLRRTGVLARSLVDETVSVVQRLLNQPLFIDEFHLYGPYEVDALYAILMLYKHLVEKPVVFSSATPADDILSELEDTGVKPEIVTASTATGIKGFAVRGNTSVTLIPIPTRRKEMPAYFETVKKVPEVIADRFIEKLDSLRDGRALLILERLWMVAELARKLDSSGLEVECIATIVPRDVCRPKAKIIVGSEATTQGVNLGKITFGVTSGTSSEDVIQRIGRVGRRGVDSEVHLIAPDYVLHSFNPKSKMGYWELVQTIKTVFPNYPKRKRDVTRLIPGDFHELRKKLIISLGLASIARVSGIQQLYDKIPIDKEDSIKLLNRVTGNSQTYVSFLVFRRTGFTVRYIVAGINEKGETSIGLITRNFKIKTVTRDAKLVIKLSKARAPLRARVLGDPSIFSGKFVNLKLFLEIVRGRIEIGEEHALEKEQIEDTVVYVVDSGEELTKYLSYTGEGAEILSPSGRRYSIIFI